MAKGILPREAGEGDHATHGGGRGSKGAAAAAPSTAFGRPPPLVRDGGGSIAETLADARARLAAAGIASAALDARLLLQAATGLDAAQLIADSREPLGENARRRFAAMLARRINREPVARILGEKEFWGRPIGLSRATLVPRPETEVLVEAALDAVRHFQLGSCIHICDLGTGSGAILMALLSELPDARGTGIDISPEALAQARRNAERLGLAERVRFHLDDFSSGPAGPCDLVVSNPPYVRTAEMANLAPEVRDYDPGTALDGGADGLDAYRVISPRLPGLLAPEGVAVFEIAAGQAGAVAALLEADGLEVCDLRPDLAGIPRALTARWPARP